MHRTKRKTQSYDVRGVLSTPTSKQPDLIIMVCCTMRAVALSCSIRVSTATTHVLAPQIFTAAAVIAEAAPTCDGTFFFFFAAFTLQLDNNLKAIRVTDSKVRARDLFLEKGELPQPGGANPLRDAWDGGYGVEVFYFPASSLKITNILR